MAIEWNQHYIERRALHEGQKGKPDLIFYCPQRNNTQSYGSPYVEEDVFAIHETLEDNITMHNYPQQFLTLVNTLIPNWEEPKDVNGALELYVQIRNEFQNL